jgi:hypothetical protein
MWRDPHPFRGFARPEREQTGANSRLPPGKRLAQSVGASKCYQSDDQDEI